MKIVCATDSRILVQHSFPTRMFTYLEWINVYLILVVCGFEYRPKRQIPIETPLPTTGKPFTHLMQVNITLFQERS